MVYTMLVADATSPATRILPDCRLAWSCVSGTHGLQLIALVDVLTYFSHEFFVGKF